MKFWQRAYYSILLLFLLCISIAIYSLSVRSYRTNLERQMEYALGESYFIMTSIEKERAAAEANGRAVTMEAVFQPYAAYYQSLGAALQLWENGTCLAGDALWLAPSETSSSAEMQTAAVKTYESTKYVVVTTSFSHGTSDYTLIYLRSLKEFMRENTQLTHCFLLISAVVAAVLAIGLYVLLRWLSRPIEALNQAAASIAAGEYAKRLPAKGQDELSELARSFNHMAEEIEQQIRALQAAAEQKQNFIDHLSHELRTPLTVIRGNAEYLRSVNLTEEEIITAANDMIAQTERLEDMTRKLLDLAFLRNQALECQPIGVSQLFDAVAKTLHPRLEQAQIRLEIPHQDGSIRGDMVLLESLLFNLIDNAIKASEAGSTIRLSGQGEPGNYTIAVEDFGAGIPAACLAKLTEPFFRVDKARSRRDGGAGLGLSLCAQIAKLHHAVLDISSTPGTGTTVRIIFTQW